MAEKLWNMLKLLPSISASRKNSLITGLARVDEKTEELILSLYHLPEPAEFLDGKNATYYAWFYDEEGKLPVKIGELQRKNGLTFGYRKRVPVSGNGLFVTVEEKGRDIKQPGVVVLASNPEVFYNELTREESVQKFFDRNLTQEEKSFVDVKPAERKEQPVSRPGKPCVIDEPVRPAAREIPAEITAKEPPAAAAPKESVRPAIPEKPATLREEAPKRAAEAAEEPRVAVERPGVEMWRQEAEIPAGEFVSPAPFPFARSAAYPSGPWAPAPQPKHGEEKSEEFKKLVSDFYSDLPGDELMGIIKDRYNALKKEIDVREYWEQCKKYAHHLWEETNLAELWEAVKKDLKYLVDKIGIHNLWRRIEKLVMDLIECLDPHEWLAKLKYWMCAADEHLHEWYDTGIKYVNAILSEVQPALLWERIKCWIEGLLEKMNIDEIIVWISVKIRTLSQMRMEDVKKELGQLFRQFADALQLPELKMAVIKVAIREKIGQVGGFFQKVKDTALKSAHDPHRPGKMNPFSPGWNTAMPLGSMADSYAGYPYTRYGDMGEIPAYSNGIYGNTYGMMANLYRTANDSYYGASYAMPANAAGMMGNSFGMLSDPYSMNGASEPVAGYAYGMNGNPYAAEMNSHSSTDAGTAWKAHHHGGREMTSSQMYANPHIFRPTIDSPVEMPPSCGMYGYPYCGASMPSAPVMSCPCARAGYAQLPCGHCPGMMQVKTDALGAPRYVYEGEDQDFFFITPDGEMIRRS